MVGCVAGATVRLGGAGRGIHPRSPHRDAGVGSARRDRGRDRPGSRPAGAVDEARALLVDRDDHAETLRAIDEAVEAANDHARRGPEGVEALGGGWIAEEALAIAIHVALVHPGPDEILEALALAVTHSGDSDSTGAICGNILGALHGETALPPELVVDLEGRGTLHLLADDLVHVLTADTLHGARVSAPGWTSRYPGS